MKDERILQMAEDDDVTLEVEEADNKAAVENMMDKALAFDSSKGRAYSFADKTRLFLEINRDDNGFYDAYKAICEYEKERIPGIEDNDIYKSKEFQDSDECKKYLEYKKHIEDIKKELKILYKRTEELNKEFDEGTSDLSKGTGFTRELLEQEIKLHHKS